MRGGGHTLYYIIASICCVEVVRRLTLGPGAGVESEAVARREVRGGIDPGTDHALVNVIPGSPLGRRKRKNQAKREMVSG